MADEYTGVALAFEVSEEKDSYAETISTDERAPSVTLRCPFENRYDLVDAIRARPWPFATGTIRPIATRFSIAGHGEPQSVNTDAQF